MENVLVFKTSVRKKMEIKKLKPLLNKLIGPKGYWNFDLEDCDNILRVQTQELKPISVTATLQQNGFHCEEL